MNKSEYIPGDDVCFDMVHRNRACRPGGEKLVLMKESQVMALLKKASGVRPKRQEPVEQEITREQLILQLAHGLVPVCIGLTWILGAFEGLADPAFTCVVAGVCGLWGCVNWKWGKFNA